MWSVLSFTSVLAFLRSVDEDMEHSQVVVYERIDNTTVLYAAKGGLNLRSFLKWRKITILLDFGLLLTVDFMSHILLLVGIMTRRADLITQWMSNTTIWLVLLSGGSMIKYNPDPDGFEGKLLGAATIIICEYEDAETSTLIENFQLSDYSTE